jgi:hypothetical protein
MRNFTRFRANVVSTVFAFARMNGFFLKRKVRCHNGLLFAVEKSRRRDISSARAETCTLDANRSG